MLVRYLFAISAGFLLVSVLFSVVDWPASELFACTGGGSFLVLYVWLYRSCMVRQKNHWARHMLVLALVGAIVMRSFGLAAGTYLVLLAFVVLLVWLVWSLLEELPPTP